MFTKYKFVSKEMDAFIIKVRDPLLFKAAYPECRISFESKDGNVSCLYARLSKSSDSKLLERIVSGKDKNIISVESSKAAFPTIPRLP